MRKQMEHTLSCPANLDKLGSVQEDPAEGVDSPGSQQGCEPPSAEEGATQTAPNGFAKDYDAPKARLLCLKPC